MCLWFACLGLHKHDNDCDHAPATRGLPVYLPPPAAGVTKSPPPLPAPRNGYHHGHGHYGNNGAQWPTPLHQTAAGADEAGCKAANDVSKGPAAAKNTPERATAHTGAAETMVTQTSPYYYYYYEPAHKEDAMDHHYAATAAAITDQERY